MSRMRRTVLIASNNPHKQKMLRWIVKDFFDKTEVLEDKTDEEEGESFREIALNKAIFYSKKFPGYTIATDAGMEIPGLDEKWNPLLTHRFLDGKDNSDIDRINELLTLMKNKNDEERTMIWHEALAIAKNGQEIFSVQVKGAKGLMQKKFDPRKYKKGIWLCSLWYFPQFKKNFFDLNKEERKYAEKSWWQLREKTRLFLKNYFEKLD